MIEHQVKYAHGNSTAQDYSLMSPNEMDALRVYCKGHRVIEIGSFRGASSAHIAKVAKELLCIDPFLPLKWGKEETIPSTFYDFLESIRPFTNVTYLKETSDEAFDHHIVQTFNPSVVFIDGDHSYTQALKDIEHYTQLCPIWVLVHDYSTMFGGVIAACNKHFQRLPDKLIDSLAIYECCTKCHVAHQEGKRTPYHA